MKCADFKKYEAMFSVLYNEFTRKFEDFEIIYSDLQLISLPFTFNVNDVQPCILIDLQSSSIVIYPKRQPVHLLKQIAKNINEMEKYGIIEKCESP